MARIALVERRAEVAAIGRAVLLGRGHAVESYEGLDDALSHLRGSPPDAVIAGSTTPPAPRLAEAVRLVRALGPGVLAFLLVPGGGDERVLVEGLDAGADDVILVPFNPADLAGRVMAGLLRVHGRRTTRSFGPPEDAVRKLEGTTERVPKPTFELEPLLSRLDGTAPEPGGTPPLTAAAVTALAVDRDHARLAGATFDDYTLVRTLGVGGMGVVVEAVHSRTGRRVALKILRDEVALERDSALRFLREAYVLQGINDRNVVRIEDIGRSDGRLFYAMELVAGENLAQRLDQEGRLEPHEAARIGVGVARALAALARRGIIHRDVKPGNVFLGDDGSVKLGDFGLAKRAFARCVTPGREPLGTPHYLAPEVVSGATASPVADIYSLGVVLYEMLAGDTPYDGRDTMALLYKVCHGPPVDLARTLPHVTEDFRAAVEKSLARDPRQRFPDAASLAKALERCRVRMR